MDESGVTEPRELKAVTASALQRTELAMNGIIYLVGLVVVVLAILSFVGLR
jgi:hypothetical protein